MKSVNRMEALLKVDQLLTRYCTGCFLYKHHRKEMSRSYAHRFCISSCTVGKQVKKYGDELAQTKNDDF